VRLARTRRDQNQNIGELIAAGVRQADRALKVRPGDYRALELRGDLLQMQLQLLPSDDAEAARLADQAERDLRASLVGNPTPAKALRILSELSARAGELQEALDYGKRAYAEDPYLDQVSFTVFRLFEYSLKLDNDTEAAKWCKEGRARFDEPVFKDCRLSLAAWSDNYPLSVDSAWALAQVELADMPAPARAVLTFKLAAAVAATIARRGMTDSALAVVRDAREREPSPGVLMPAAGVYGLLRMPDSSFSILDAMLAKSPNMRGSLEHAPELRALRGDARFRRLVGGESARR
jgi:tetratricopeptide (TPR) repeat protein